MKTPPKALRVLLRVCCPSDRFDDVSGDLNEMYHTRHTRSGGLNANLLYLLESISLLSLKAITGKRKVESNPVNLMLKNYFKITLRNLVKDKTYSIINLSGLAVGLACAFLILIYVRLELSFDTFHEKANHIYRVQHVYSVIGAPIGPAMVEEYPEIIDCTRIYLWSNQVKTLTKKDEAYFEDYYLTDHNFFKTFTFNFIHGDPSTALSGPESLVITESTAIKYFGHTDVIGEVIRAETLNHLPQTPLKITGVIEDVPYNSQLQFTHVGSLNLILDNPQVNIQDSWINDWIATYLVLIPNTNTKPIEEGYWDFFESHTGTRYDDPFKLMPLTDVRHHSGYLRADFLENTGGDIEHIRIFSAVAILVLLIACINYMNLSTARANKRMKEVGLRKVLGAVRKQLVVQFLVESVLITLLSLVLATCIIYFSIPVLSALTGINLQEGLTDISGLVLSGISIALLTGLIAGSYPAFYLSSFQVSSILKESKHKSSKGMIIRRLLVISQLTVSISLIIIVLVVLDQMEYIKGKELGFNMEEVLLLDYGRNPSTNENWDYLKSAFLNLPGVTDVATSNSVPGDNAGFWRYHFEDAESEEGDGFPGYYIGERFTDVLEMEVIIGRTFSESIESDKNAFLLTEKAWKEIINLHGHTWENPIGKNIQYETTFSGDWSVEKEGPVIGVVKDFHSRSLQMPTEALILQQANRNHHILLKVPSEMKPELIDQMNELWSTLPTSKPFNYQFMEDRFAEYYASEKRFGQLLNLFCFLAIFIACMGLFGLASFTTQERVKEIGIRKVLGASTSEILRILTIDILLLVAIAIFISFPLAWYSANSWLDNFTYRVDIQWYNFMVGATIILLLTLTTISMKVIRSSLANPVDSLKYE